MPATSSTDKAASAAADFTDTLQNPAPAALFSHLGDKQTTALKDLADIFKKATPTAAPAKPAAPEPVGPAQQVPRVDTPGKSRQQPLPRVPQNNNTPAGEVLRVEPPPIPEPWHKPMYANETSQSAKNRPRTRL